MDQMQNTKNIRTIEAVKKLTRENGMPKEIYIDNGYTYVPVDSENSPKKSENM
ncbi:Uncharacterised protein [uncultured Clostridium sp.]